MPRVTWVGGKPKKPPDYNRLAAVLRGYKLASGLSSEEIGERLGVTAAHVRHQIGQPADRWRIGSLKALCDVIGCPHQEALQAAAQQKGG